MRKDVLNSEFYTTLPLSKLKDDDQLAFSQIVHAFSAELFIYAVKLTKCKDDAEDLLQDVFTDLWGRRHEIQVTTSLKSYLYVALKNRFLRKVMRANLNEKALEYLTNRMQAIEFTVIDLMAASEVEDTIAKALDKLPQHMRNVFLLRRQDLSIREIAIALGLAEQTVKTYHMEVKRKVKNAILTHHPEVSHSLVWCLISAFTIN